MYFSITLISKVITGYFNLQDVTNGIVALKISKLNSINIDLIKKNFFFEQDLIFHLSLKNFRLFQLKTETIYEDEKSNLKPIESILPFTFYHIKNLIYKFFN